MKREEPYLGYSPAESDRRGTQANVTLSFIVCRVHLGGELSVCVESGRGD